MIEERIKLDHVGINVRYSLDHKPVVLFLHYSGGNMHMWDGIIPQFTNTYSIITPECLGHGKSDKPQTGYHINDMANDIYLLLQHLQIEQCHVVGSSMGAEVGLSLAASHPELVMSLTCEGALYNEFGVHGLFKGTQEEIECKKETYRAEMAERKDRVFRTQEEYVEEERAQLIEEGLWNEHFLAFYDNNLQQTQDGNFALHYLNRVRTEYIQAYWDVKFEEYYRQVKCPVLFLPSAEEWADEQIRSCVQTFSDLVEVNEIECIPHSVHAYVWMQIPLAASEAVIRFIGKYNSKETLNQPLVGVSLH